MKRAGIAIMAAAFLTLTASPVFAQTEEKPDETQVEPVEPVYNLYVSDYRIDSDGQDTKSLSAGSDARIRLTLTNGGEERARDVSLVMRSDNRSIEVLDARATLGDIGSGDTASGTFTVRVHEENCTQDGALIVKISSSLGERDEYTGGQVLCPGPNVYPGEIRYEGGDGDNVPEPGERLKVFVTLYNYGRDAATDVIGRIKIDNPDVTVIERASAWPTIRPNEGGEATEAFVIQIADDAKVQENGCGYDGGPEPAPMPADEPVSSEPETIVVDEQAARDADGGGEPGSTGAGSSGSTGSEEPVKEEPLPADEPRHYEEPDPAVEFEAQLVVTASGKDFESGFGTQMYCALAEGRPASGGPADGRVGGSDDIGAPENARDLAGGLPVAKTTPTRATHVATAGALLALVAGGLLFRRSFGLR